MFGIKLRSWMEAHIVRPRKKRSKEAKGAAKSGKGGGSSTTTLVLPDPPAKSALADPSPASASPAAAPAKRVTLVSPTPSCRVSHGDRGSSPRRPPLLPAPGHHRRPGSPSRNSGARYSTYLSSPESAYSTGYSTDATSPHGYSPGTSLPPEYYINLRTGTRYFQSAERQLQQQQQDVARASTSSGRLDQQQQEEGACRAARDERVRFGHQRTQSTAGPVLQQPHHHPYCRHTVAKVTCTTLEEGGFSYGAPVPPRHRRSESSDVTPRALHPHVTIRTSFAQVEEVSVCHTKSPPSMVQQQQIVGCNSPRQRSRIRTNPWMSTTGSSSTATAEKWTTSSSCSDIAPTPQQDISTAATIGSWRRDDGHTTTTTTADEESAAEEVTVFRRPSRRRRQMLSPSAARRGSLTSVSCSSSSSPCSTPLRSSPSHDDEEDDLTLNEIGRFDESYVYEKETDILSDSDPTDCDEEDDDVDNNNAGNLTDRHSSNDYLDMSYQNGINSHCDFDELDFIDNGPLDLSSEMPPAPRINTGHCTYHHPNMLEYESSNNVNNNINKNAVNKRSSRRRESSKRANSRRDQASPARKPSQKSRGRSGSSGGRRREPRPQARVLAEAEVSSSGQATPVVSNSNTPVATRRNTDEKRSRYMFASEVRLIEADKEADRKYQQLILEAESLLVHMKSTSVEEEDEVDLETPTVEQPPRPFPAPVQSPPRQRPNTASLHLQVGEASVTEQEPQRRNGQREPPPPRRRQMQQSVVAIQVTTPSGGPPRELVTFRSVDLSSPVAAEAPYCPQSEPLKRKVYTSAALQRLQEHLALADCAESSDSSPPDDDEQSAQDRLGQKVAALRRERLAAEARLANREEERKRRRERIRAQQQLALERRNTLLQTLESLKRDLQRNLGTPVNRAALAPGTPSQEKPRCDFLSPIRRASSLRCRVAPPPPPRRC
ncbi:hypothetical protein B566_EDAN003482 [Ephemera danica]|nr:hypothetical protein B566_EDAN003482 [Ephemera danica]